MPQLKLHLFGAPEIFLDDQPIHITRRKAIAMLIFLIVTGKPQSRDTLGLMFWPESSDSRKQVRVALSSLRSALGHKWFTDYSEVVRVANVENIWADVLAFKSLSQTAAVWSQSDVFQLEGAIALLRGHFLAGFTLRDCPDFDAWTRVIEQELDHLIDQVLRSLVQHYDAMGDSHSAIKYAERQIVHDDLNEVAYQQLMTLYLKYDQPNEVVRVYRACVETLEDKLSIRPTPDTEVLYQQAITRHDTKTVVSNVLSLPQEDTIPYFHHTFFGRDEELATVHTKLQHANCRLISLVGIGGIGKTHLASQIVERLSLNLAYPTVFLSLEGIIDPEQAMLMLAAKLQHQLLLNSDTLDQIITFLKDHALLIVLDNLEQLVPAINPFINRLLQETNYIKFLITSRVMLQLHEEHVIRLRGLDLPPQDLTLNLDDLMAYDSVRFFVHWAGRRNAAFSLDIDNADAITELCRINDGVPLSIRLSAVWCELLKPDELLHEIRQNIYILESNLSDIPEKHRSLRALFDSIWAQLHEKERKAFIRLSAFRGGFTREAAEQVTGVKSPTLKSLLDKSLLVVDHGLGRRYHIHEMLRLYALQSGDPLIRDHTLAERFVRYYANFISQREHTMKGSDQLRAVLGIDGEFGNIQQAWHLATERRIIAALLDMVNGLFLYLRVRGYWNEGFNLFQGTRHVLETDDMLDADTRHLINRLSIRYYQVDQNDLVRLLNILPDVEAYEDWPEVLFLLTTIGWKSRDLGHHRLSRRYFQIARRYAAQLNDDHIVAEMIRGIALSYAALGDTATAHRFNQESIQMRQQAGNQFDLVINYVLQGELTMLRGDVDGAIKALLKPYDYNVQHIGVGRAHIHTKFLAWCFLFAGDLMSAEKFARELTDVTNVPGLEGDHVIGSLALSVLAALAGSHDESNRILEACKLLLKRDDLTTDMIRFTNTVRLLTMMMITLATCLNGHINQGQALINDLSGREEMIRYPLIAQTLFTAQVLLLMHEKGDALQPDLIDWLHDQPWLVEYMSHVQSTANAPN